MNAIVPIAVVQVIYFVPDLPGCISFPIGAARCQVRPKANQVVARQLLST